MSTSPLLPTPDKMLDSGNDTMPSLKGKAPLERIAGPGEKISVHTLKMLSSNLKATGYMLSFQPMVS